MFLQFIRKKDYFIGDEGKRWRNGEADLRNKSARCHGRC